MRILTAWIGMAVAIAIGTAFINWWMVPMVSLVWTLALPRRGGVMIAALSGAAAWGALLLLVRRDGPLGTLDRVLSGTLQMPPGSGIALTITYAALLAGAAALVAQAVRPPVRNRQDY